MYVPQLSRIFLRKTVTKIVSWVWLQCEDCSHTTGIISYTYIVVVSLLFQMWEERSHRQNIRHSWTKSSALLSGATERRSSQRGIKTHSLYFSFHSLKSSLSFLFSLQLGTCLVFSGALLPVSLLTQASVFCFLSGYIWTFSHGWVWHGQDCRWRGPVWPVWRSVRRWKPCKERHPGLRQGANW